MPKKRVNPARLMPDWNVEQLKQLDTWLSGWINHCHAAAARCRDLERQGGGAAVGETAAYWDHAASGLCWVRAQLRKSIAVMERKQTG